MKEKVNFKRPKENMHASIALPDAGTYSEKKPNDLKKSKKISTSNKIAGDRFCKINVLHHLLKSSFPGEQRLWHVDKVYPYSKYGEILFDEPNLPYNIKDCKRKLQVFKEAGIKYVILKGGTIPIGCTDDEISMNEFGEVIE